MLTNKLALGTAQFGLSYGVANQVGQVHPSTVRTIIEIARSQNIDMIDTARVYGTSEEVLGKAGVSGFRVVTKLPSFPIGKPDVARWVRGQIEASLKHLCQEKLYGLLLHRPQDLFGWKSEELIQSITDLKSAGLVLKIGVSIYSPDELDEVYKKIKIDLVQAPLNVIDRRLQSSGWLDRLKDDGVEVHTRSTFLQGLLLIERDKIPKSFSRWSNLWDQWHEHLKRSGTSALAACLAYPLSLEQIDRVIVGIDSTAQFGDILAAAHNLDDVFDALFMCSEDLDLINPYNWDRL